MYHPTRIERFRLEVQALRDLHLVANQAARLLQPVIETAKGRKVLTRNIDGARRVSDRIFLADVEDALSPLASWLQWDLVCEPHGLQVKLAASRFEDLTGYLEAYIPVAVMNPDLTISPFLPESKLLRTDCCVDAMIAHARRRAEILQELEIITAELRGLKYIPDFREPAG